MTLTHLFRWARFDNARFAFHCSKRSQYLHHYKLFTIFTTEVSRINTSALYTTSVLSVTMVTQRHLQHPALSHGNTKHFQYGGPLALHLLLARFDYCSLDGATVDYKRLNSSADTNIPFVSYYDTKQAQGK